MLHTNILLIILGCPLLSIALQYRIVAENTIHSLRFVYIGTLEILIVSCYRRVF